MTALLENKVAIVTGAGGGIGAAIARAYAAEGARVVVSDCDAAATGTYGSVQLLLLSGVGPADRLSPLGIESVRELPVGQKLQDHLAVFLNCRTDRESLMTVLSPQNPALLQPEGCGPLASNVGEAGGFLQTRPGLVGPEVQFHQVPALFYDEGKGPLMGHGSRSGVSDRPDQPRRGYPADGVARAVRRGSGTTTSTQMRTGPP